MCVLRCLFCVLRRLFCVWIGLFCVLIHLFWEFHRHRRTCCPQQTAHWQGLLCVLRRLCCKRIGLFCGSIGLFCVQIGLFCVLIGLFWEFHRHRQTYCPQQTAHIRRVKHAVGSTIHLAERRINAQKKCIKRQKRPVHTQKRHINTQKSISEHITHAVGSTLHLAERQTTPLTNTLFTVVGVVCLSVWVETSLLCVLRRLFWEFLWHILFLQL